MSDFALLESRAKRQENFVEHDKLEIEESKDENCMNVDSGSDFKGSSELYFLKSVLCKEIGADLSDNKLVFLAVRAVFLETGFVGFDPLSGSRVEQSSLPFTDTVCYTLPELLSINNGTESISLKFQTLGDYVNVFGSFSSSSEILHKLNIEKTRFVPAIGKFCAFGDTRDSLNDKDSTKSYNEEVIFEFLRIVKDGLALHLMIDLCEKTGLDPPPCLMGLPADLKVQILELLSGEDTARVACVCKEMCYLSSKDELWKEKYRSEYGNRASIGARDTCKWKTRFESSSVIAKHRKKRWSRLKNRLRAIGDPDAWFGSSLDDSGKREGFGATLFKLVQTAGDVRALLAYYERKNNNLA